jgi:succinate dehydrogenase / fumarate reductase, cytochrome b subunit
LFAAFFLKKDQDMRYTGFNRGIRFFFVTVRWVSMSASPKAPIAPRARPLSPHLQIYKWSWTMAMSVLHRITGTALYGGTLLLALWLIALATSPDAFETVRWGFGTWLGRLILFGYTWALLHHMFGGIRHFIWDTGAGFEGNSRKHLAQLTLVLSLVLTVAVWGFGYMIR